MYDKSNDQLNPILGCHASIPKCQIVGCTVSWSIAVAHFSTNVNVESTEFGVKRGFERFCEDCQEESHNFRIFIREKTLSYQFTTTQVSRCVFTLFFQPSFLSSLYLRWSALLRMSCCLETHTFSVTIFLDC